MYTDYLECLSVINMKKMESQSSIFRQFHGSTALITFRPDFTSQLELKLTSPWFILS